MAFKMLREGSYIYIYIYILILLLGQELLQKGLYLDLAIEMEGIEVLSLL